MVAGEYTVASAIDSTLSRDLTRHVFLSTCGFQSSPWYKTQDIVEKDHMDEV